MTVPMTFEFSPVSMAMFFGAAVSAAVFFLVWPRRSSAGALPLALMMVSVTIWGVTYGLEMAATTVEGDVFWSTVSYFGIVTSSPFYLLFALQFTRQAKWLKRSFIYRLLWIIPAITMALVLTNESHHQVWTSFTPASPQTLKPIIYGHGPWFWVFLSYTYLLLMVGTILMLQNALRTRQIFRRQAIVVLIGVPLPILADIAYVFQWEPVRGIDLTPVAFAFTGAMLAIGIYRQRLFDLVPVARESLVEIMREGVVVLDNNERVLDLNPSAQQILGGIPGMAIGQPAEVVLAPLLQGSRGKLPDTETEVTVLKSGCTYQMVRYPLTYDQSGQPGSLLILHDITDARRAGMALQEKTAELEQFFNCTLDMLCITDTNGIFRRLNREWENVLGYSLEEMQGRRLLDFVHPDDQSISRTSLAALGAQNEVLNFTNRLRCKNGTYRWIEWRSFPSGHMVYASARDITHRKHYEQELTGTNTRLQGQLDEIGRLQHELREQAIRDVLTGLFNRRYLEETLEREIARGQREGYPVSLVMLDIDRFKLFNDLNGHPAGDAMLQSVAQLLQARVRAGDIVCRFGGEEFVVVMPAVNAETALLRAEEWRAAFQHQLVTYEGQMMKSTFSAGVAAFPEHARKGSDVLRLADKAMYLAKKRGRNQVALWEGAEPGAG